MGALNVIGIILRGFLFIGFFIVLLDFVNEESYLRPLLLDLAYIIAGIVITPILLIQELLIYFQYTVDPNAPTDTTGLIEIFQKYIQLFLVGILSILGWIVGRSPSLFIYILEAPFEAFRFIFGDIIIGFDDLSQVIGETGGAIYFDLWDLYFEVRISIGIPGLSLGVSAGISIFQHDTYGFLSAFATLDLVITLFETHPQFIFNIWDELMTIFQLENYGFPSPIEWFQEVLANA